MDIMEKRKLFALIGFYTACLFSGLYFAGAGYYFACSQFFHRVLFELTFDSGISPIIVNCLIIVLLIGSSIWLYKITKRTNKRWLYILIVGIVSFTIAFCVGGVYRDFNIDKSQLSKEQLEKVFERKGYEMIGTVTGKCITDYHRPDFDFDLYSKEIHGKIYYYYICPAGKYNYKMCKVEEKDGKGIIHFEGTTYEIDLDFAGDDL